MARNTPESYGNESISQLKGEDRVRKRPAVIFGSDGLEGCEHAVFEILSNSIDEARAGNGSIITLTRYLDKSIECEDFGRGCPVDWNPAEKKYNWELVFCELYAGGKYRNNEGGDYEYSLGLNGLGTCATQYSSEYMDVTVRRDGKKYTLHFEKGRIKGKLEEEPADRKKTGTDIRWRPDLEVFTDIDIPLDYYTATLKRQAVVNAGVTFRLRNEIAQGKFDTTDFLYENGILDYVSEIAGEETLSTPCFIQAERKGRDRADKPEYKVKLSAAFCFSNKVNAIEYYHNSSFLEHGGAPEKAARSAFVSAVDAYIKKVGKYQKNESKISFQDVQDCLVLVTNCFSTQTSYENQTKKAITNRFIQEAMTDFLRSQLEVYFIEHKAEADRVADQVLINKRSREQAEKARLNIRKKLTGSMDISNRVQKLQALARRGVPGHNARARQDPQLPEGRLRAHFQKRDNNGPHQGPGLRRGGAEAYQGAARLRAGEPALEQGHHLHGCGRGRLPDTHAHPDDALPPGADAHPRGLRLHRGVAAVRDRIGRQDLVRLLRAREGGDTGGHRPRQGHDKPLQGPGRERPGHDVADDDEPRDAPAHPGHA